MEISLYRPSAPKGHRTVHWGQVQTRSALLAVVRSSMNQNYNATALDQSAARDSAELEG